MTSLNNWSVINSVLYYKSLSVRLTDKGYIVKNTQGVVVYVGKSLDVVCENCIKYEPKWSKLNSVGVEKI